MFCLTYIRDCHVSAHLTKY